MAENTMTNDGFEEVVPGLTETWSPEKEGDVIQGKLVEVKTGLGANESTLYVLEKEDGEQISFWSSAVLDTLMGEVNLLDEVRVMYMGKKESPKTGRTYKDFKVGVKRATGTV